MNKPKIAIVAGGTGGHFFPAKALAMQLKERNYPVVFMTDKRIEDPQLAEWNDIQQFVIDGGGIAKKSITQKISNGFELLKGVAQSRKILKNNPVAAIIGFGGYPSIPPLVAARLFPKKKRPQIILHEGNAIIGKANAMLSHFATIIATSYPKVAGIPKHIPVKITGLPVRPDITSLYPASYQAPTDTISLLIWGGSLGAKIFGEIVPYALANLPIEIKQKLRITQQVRKEDLSHVTQIYEKANIQATLAPFLTNVSSVLKQAHLVIGRAGGSSVSELSLSGKPAILVPYPFAANQEQHYNAKALEQEGSAWIIDQKDFSVTALTALLSDLLNNPDKLRQAAQSHHLVYPNAAKELADLIESYITL
ncbi:undecaprenyldiphospho-muramoylpentapeptide beta-N-acetylglucosaminyltransferase [Commensalibacter nepenthis]|uniref:UDP-N-acetylglucosamine--N-acetylmuramyl-(pentapeptide) pyrophosphoryl-undecaprenol N-acetylglucosamine transferase n=1 Tax=Commensalibacter nepenthis TaxID=3043872 RepID=A0ABT6Q6V6_9PROT|nr:undecaprenyldiphospho-muramoylpentapeptide beta-N-acetylglucosaminyltransferase [Commensalibacter sp. TBRC 10068]MDI2112507.1 undecaprenyldiphospho-muramoylpentapeptide beta-N-acetylglucosaminyltransferase [Commensalibacter sp. TBRC 10068]